MKGFGKLPPWLGESLRPGAWKERPCMGGSGRPLREAVKVWIALGGLLGVRDARAVRYLPRTETRDKKEKYASGGELEGRDVEGLGVCRNRFLPHFGSAVSRNAPIPLFWNGDMYTGALYVGPCRLLSYFTGVRVKRVP